MHGDDENAHRDVAQINWRVEGRNDHSEDMHREKEQLHRVAEALHGRKERLHRDVEQLHSLKESARRGCAGAPFDDAVAR